MIEGYLPAELSDAELDALVAQAIAETGAAGPRDMGRVIKHVMAAAGGRADGKRVSTKVKEALGCRRQLELSNEVAAELAGAQDAILRTLEEHLSCDVFLRGNVVTLDGDAEAVQLAADRRPRAVRAGRPRARDRAGHDRVRRPRARPGASRPARCSTTSSGATATSRSRPSRSTRSATSTRSSATRSRSGSARPAPARRSWPWRMATAALSRREVNRIILTRPAVEAGERLGFLPGDLMAKVDPYLRPLFDALHDMIDAERVAAAPRARRDRGRAAGLHAWPRAARRPAGPHADGLPARSARCGSATSWSARTAARRRCSGVYPQGRKPVFRVEAQDGASTLCCAEHLWFVTTPDDRKHGKPGRVLETREMIGRLRRHHQHRFELPLVSAPVEFEPREVPLDPYALGLLLGDGCLTATTTPTLRDGRSGARRRRSRRALPRHRAAPQERGRLRPATRRWAPRRRHRRQPGHGGAPRARARGHALQDQVRAGRVPAQRVERAARPCSRGCSTATAARSRRPAARCRIQYTTCSSRLRDDVVLPRPVARRRGLLATTARPPDAAPGRARGRRRPPPQRRLRPRHPPARGRRAVPPHAQARHVYERARRRAADALRRAHRAGRRGRDRLHPGRRRGLAVRHRRLPRHAQHAQ